MMKNKQIKTIAIWSVSLIIVAVALLWLFAPRAIKVDVVTVNTAPFVQSIEEDAKTRAKDVFKIISPIKGELLRIQLEAGDTVKKGQVIAKIIPSRSILLDKRTRKVLSAFLLSQQASVKRAEAMVARANAAVATAASDYKRNYQLSKKDFVSASALEQFSLQLNLRKKEYDAAVAELNEVKQRVETVRSALVQFTSFNENGTENEDKIYVRSPENARILKVIRKSAGSVQQGEAIVELADAHKLEVVADLLSTQAVKIPNNAKVIIKRWGKTYPLYGHVTLVEPNAFTKTSALGIDEQRVNVIIAIDSEKSRWHQLGAGYRVDVNIITYSTKSALQIPISALFRDKDKWAVFTIQNGKANKQIIQIGRRNADMAIVLKGLKLGDKVINYPSDQVKAGVRVSM